MPIYEYRCDSCGFQKEYIQRMSDALLTDCPECQKATFSKMVTAAGFQLKGGGWYVTDFKSGGSNTAAVKKSVEKQTDTSGSPDAAKTEKSKSENSASSAVSAPSSTPAASGTPAPSGVPAPSSSSSS